MGVASSLGLISGIDYEELVSKLISLERNPITLLQNKKTDIELKMGAFSALDIKLSSLKSTAEILNDEALFNAKLVNVSSPGGGPSLTATVTNSASLGSTTVYVDQLAQAHKVASQGWADVNATPVLDSATYPSGGNFSFRVGNSGATTTIQVTTTTTLQELQDMINESDTGVTATILNDGTASNPYRLILGSDTTGASNDIQITTNVTQLDFTNKIIEEATSDTTNSGTYTGTVASNTAESYTGTTNKTYIIQTMTAGTVGAAGTARYRYSTDGGINWNDNGGSGFAFYTGALTTIGSTDGTNNTGNSENVKVQFTDSGTMSLGDTFRVDVFNPAFSEPKDAVIRVDSLTLIKASNTITDVIDGVTLNLLNADATNPNTVTVSQGDVSATKTHIEDFVAAYNTVIEDLYNAFSYDPENPTANNPLRGDYTVRGIQARLKDIVVNRVPGLEGDYTTLYQIGISVDTTGRLSIDGGKLSSVLAADPLSVMKLFVDYATPTDNAISYEGKTSTTKAGKYSVYVNTPPAQATFESSEVIDPGGIGEDETLTFTYTNEATGAVPTVTAFSVNLSAGDTVNTIVSRLNSKFSSEKVGLVASNNGGMLKIASTDYGSTIKFTVVSDKAGTQPQTDTQSFYVGAGDGFAQYRDSSWNTAHDATDGETADDTGNLVEVNQVLQGGQYTVGRAFFPVDTSIIPDGATINSADFRFYVDSSRPGGSSYSYRLVETSQASTSGVQVADFDQAGAVDNPAAGAADLDIGQGETGWRTFSLNATGLGWINRTGFTPLGIRGQTFDGADLPADARAELDIRTSEYGGTSFDPYLEVTYTYNAGPSQTGIGTDMVTATGTDVVGSINGHVALGKGKYLTGITGFDEAGLQISTTSTTAGGKGYVSVSSGIAAQLSDQLEYITDPFRGSIASRNDALRDVIDDIDDRIEIKERRLEIMEESLRKEFANLEVLLSSMQSQMDYLSSQLNSLPQLYMGG